LQLVKIHDTQPITIAWLKAKVDVVQTQ